MALRPPADAPIPTMGTASAGEGGTSPGSPPPVPAGASFPGSVSAGVPPSGAGVGISFIRGSLC